MNVTQTIKRSYVVDPTGIIFTSDVTRTVSDDGSLDVCSLPHRTPYEPGTDLTANGDDVLKRIALAAWTPDVVSAYRAGH